MEKFNWQVRVGNFKDCSFCPRHYGENNNKALQVIDDEGVVCTATVNVGKVPDDCIAVKDYSENEGVQKELIRLGIIEEIPVNYIPSGFVIVPVHKLTEKGMKLWEDK